MFNRWLYPFLINIPCVVVVEKPPKKLEDIIQELVLTNSEQESIFQHETDFRTRANPKLSGRYLRRKKTKHKSPWQ